MGSFAQSLERVCHAKNKDEYDKMERYARIIQESQHDLGLEISSFDNIGMSATSFLWEFIRKEDNDSILSSVYTKTMRIKLIGSLMIMPIVKNLRMTIIN